jgi:hypothetical protein
MRLINTSTLELEEFPGHEGLQYVILSHRWEPGEVSFQDYESGAGQSNPGYWKIERCCRQAAEDGYSYAWVDTCCIDKTSSAELSEALNSMFRWYSSSAVCYAFLSDVQADAHGAHEEHNTWSTDSSTVRKTPAAVPESFARSAWFRRGWTLQELLAPAEVRFFDRGWTALGTKRGLCGLLSRITNIDHVALASGGYVHKVFSAAQVMSWAARRATTRPEDRAYSLMGLFDVHLPLLYGEGGVRAFRRLQEEIIRQSDDQSILAWTSHGDGGGGEHGHPGQQLRPWGLLADTPACFARCGQMERIATDVTHAYAMTNRGLHLTLCMTPWAADTYLALLACCDYGTVAAPQRRGDYRLGVFLRRRDARSDLYERVTVDGRDHTHVSAAFRDDRPWNQLPATVQTRYYTDSADRLYGFRINSLELRDGEPHDLQVIDCDAWGPQQRVLEMATKSHGAAGTLLVPPESISRIGAIKLGFDFDFNPVIFIGEVGPGLADRAYTCSALSMKDCFSYSGWCRVVKGLLTTNLGGSIWAIKGDRLTGLEVVIISTKSDLRVHIDIFRDLSDDFKVWDVNIRESDDLSPTCSNLPQPQLVDPDNPDEI